MAATTRASKPTRARRGRGSALLELALVAPILVFLLFGMIDFGRALLARHAITSLSREAANLESRGTTFPDTLQAILQSSGSLDLAGHGYVVLTAVTRDGNGNLRITQQEAAGGHPAPSRVGTLGGGPVTLPNSGVPLVNQTLYVAEVFLDFAPVTPIGSMLGSTLPSSWYDVAFF
jgi:hypothetical protein